MAIVIKETTTRYVFHTLQEWAVKSNSTKTRGVHFTPNCKCFCYQRFASDGILDGSMHQVNVLMEIETAVIFAIRILKHEKMQRLSVFPNIEKYVSESQKPFWKVS